jgi:hypothetical protein
MQQGSGIYRCLLPEMNYPATFPRWQASGPPALVRHSRREAPRRLAHPRPYAPASSTSSSPDATRRPPPRRAAGRCSMPWQGRGRAVYFFFSFAALELRQVGMYRANNECRYRVTMPLPIRKLPNQLATKRWHESESESEELSEMTRDLSRKDI